MQLLAEVDGRPTDDAALAERGARGDEADSEQRRRDHRGAAPDAPCRSASGRAGAITHSPTMPMIVSTPRWVAGLSVSVAATPMIAPPSPPAL